MLPSFAGGGAERVLIAFANNLNRDRFAPRLIVFSDSGPLLDSVAADVAITNLDRPRLRQAILPLRRELLRTGPECVVSTMGYLNLAILATCRAALPQTAFIVREANTVAATQQAIGWPWLVQHLYRRLYGRTDAIICPSERIADEMKQRLGIPGAAIHLIYNPIDVSAIRQATAQPKRVPGAGLRFVAAGRLTPQKGFDRLIDMFAKMPADAHLTILGDGLLNTALRDQARQMDLADRIAFPGFLASPWPAFGGADAFLLPSRWEGLPNAALEALVCGTPVIATPEAGGIREISNAAVTGAVTIAEAGGPFIAAMRATIANPIGRPRESLLPDRFTSQSVQSSFERLLHAILISK